MARARRIDDNQREIVDYLREVGITVAITAGLGDGFPDLVVSYEGETVVVEIKDGNKIPSKRQLTEAEEKFRAGWQGEYRLVESIADADKLISFLKRGVTRRGGSRLLNEKVLEALDGSGPLTVEALAYESELTVGAVQRAIGVLLKQGEVREDEISGTVAYSRIAHTHRGWAKVGRVYHYFSEGMGLCGERVYVGPVETGTPLTSECCKRCLHKLAPVNI